MMVAEFRKRKDYIVGALNDIPGIHCPMPGGAFYVFPNVSGLYGRSYEEENHKFDGVYRISARWRQRGHVPGVAFGSDDHIRLSYATSHEH